MTDAGTMAGEEVTWHRVAAPGDIVEGEPIAIRVGDLQIALCRLEDGLYAFENVCPHAYALLSDGFISGTEIECPLHAAAFDIKTGECLAPPADRDLVVYPVRVDGDDVFVGVAA
jgi:3-phenylpropionate/trans-cinnamate dioxygenase ferredoxin component